MINYLVYVFILWGFVLRMIFTVQTAWWLNALIIFVCRGLYMLGFYLYYFKFPAPPADQNGKDTAEQPKFDSRRFIILFAIKNGILILICTFSMPLAAFCGVYSLLTCTAFIRHVAGRHPKQELRTYLVIGTYLFNILALVGFAFLIIAINPQISMDLPIDLGFEIGATAILVFGLIGSIIYLFPGKLFTRLPLSFYSRKILGRLKPKVRTIALVVVVTLPSLFLIGTLVWSIPQKESYMLPMRDGVRLATDVYFSPLVGRHPAPVVLVRSPYGMRETAPEYDFATYGSMGCHLVEQDIRGTFGSEGIDTTIMFIHEAYDGNDTINWIMQQEWCNGQVIGSGISAMAIAQYLAAGTAPKGLVAQSLFVGTPDVIADAILEGAVREHLIDYWSKMTCPNSWGMQQDFLYDALNNPSSQDVEPISCVELLNAPNTFAQVNVAGLHVGGWYDIFIGGTLRGYKGYDDLGGDNARGKQKLIIGPWCHGMWSTMNQGELTYPSNSIGSSLMSKWEQLLLDEVVFGRAHPEQWDKRVAYYLMGDVDSNLKDANIWKYADDWPLPSTLNPWYFGLKGGKTVLVDDEAGLDGAANLSYMFNPNNPVKTRGGNNLFTEPMGPVDQRPVDEPNGVLRSDILRFESDVLQAPYTIEGDLSAKLVITSNCSDTDFMVKVMDVYPDGRQMLIRDGALTARCRDVDFTALTAAERRITENFLVSGTTYDLIINLSAIAYQFNTGHKISIIITSSNYPRYKINPNTGGSMSQHFSEGVIANNTILTGPGLSCIYMPEL